MGESLRDHWARVLIGTGYSALLGVLTGSTWILVYFRSENAIPVRSLDVAMAWVLEAGRGGALFALVGLLLSLSLGTLLARQPRLRRFRQAWGHGPRGQDTAPILVLTMVVAGILYTYGIVADLPVLERRMGLRIAAVVLTSMAVGVGFRRAFKLDDVGQGRGPRFLFAQPVLWLLSIMMASLGAQPRDATGSSAVEARPSILLVTVDGYPSFRADAAEAPASFHWMARRGVVLEQAVSVTPAGLPALASLFTGMHPYALELVENMGRLPRGSDRLPSLFQDDGYATGAFVSSLVYQRESGLGQGFQVYDDGVGSGAVASLRHPSLRLWRRALQALGAYDPSRQALRSDAATVSAFEAWFKRHARENFFAWVQLSGPTRPYQHHQLVGVPEAPPGIAGAYRSEVDAADALLGRLLSVVESAGVLDSCVIVLTAPFGEDPEGEGHEGLGEAVVHVPMVIVGPGLRRRVVASQVRLYDLFPTLITLSGRREDFSIFDGENLVPALRGEEQESLQAFLITRKDDGWDVGLRMDTWKFVRTGEGRETLTLLDPKTGGQRPPEGPQSEAMEAGRLGLVGLLGGAEPNLPAPLPWSFERERALSYLAARPTLLP